MVHHRSRLDRPDSQTARVELIRQHVLASGEALPVGVNYRYSMELFIEGWMAAVCRFPAMLSAYTSLLRGHDTP